MWTAWDTLCAWSPPSSGPGTRALARADLVLGVTTADAAALTLTQSAPAGYPTLRPHRMDIALVRASSGGALTVEQIETELQIMSEKDPVNK